MNKIFVKLFQKIFGLSDAWTDSRSSAISVSIARIAIFSSALMIHFVVIEAMLSGDFETYVKVRESGVYNAFSILKVFGEMPLPAEFWNIIRWASLISTIMAIIGFITRPSMVISIVSLWLLILFDISRYSIWSHPYNVVILCGLSFMFVQAGGYFTLDRVISNKFNVYPFGKRGEPITWGVLSAQYSAALFFFAAFWAKIMVTNYGIDYVFSDTLRNIFAVTWAGYVEHEIPGFVNYLASSPLLWKIATAIHLIMQALPIYVFFAVSRPFVRFLEGINYFVSALLIALLMSVFNPWWFLMALLFIDWDYYLNKIRCKIAEKQFDLVMTDYRFSKPKGLAIYSYVTLFFIVYFSTFLSQTSDKLGLYPFSDFNMYAAVYDTKPYDTHRPYIDILRGEISVQTPDAVDDLEFSKQGRWVRLDTLDDKTRKSLLPKISRKTTIDEPLLYDIKGNQIHFPAIPNILHLIARRESMTELKGGVEEFVQFIEPMPVFHKDTLVVVKRNTTAFKPWPENLGEKEKIHEGVRCLYRIADGKFIGLSSSYISNRTIEIITEGDTNILGVYARPNVYDANNKVVNVPGKWDKDNQFTISKDFYEKYKGRYMHTFYKVDTEFGVYDFDGKLSYWN